MSKDKKKKSEILKSAVCVCGDVYPGGNLTQEVGFDTHTELYVVPKNFSCFGQLHILKRLPVHLQYLLMGVKRIDKEKYKMCQKMLPCLNVALH